MLYTNRNYPHPVLGISDDYDKSTLIVNLSISASFETITINPIFSLANSELEKLVSENKLLFVTQIYCRGTLYREAISSEKPMYKINIPATNFNGEVETDFFILAKEKIENFRSPDMAPIFGESKFNFEKSEIVGYAGKARFFANKTYSKSIAISSIINIVPTEHKKHAFKLDYSGNRIAILLCTEDYDNYKLLKANPKNIELILCSLVLPALVEIFYFIDSDESSEFIDQYWYKLLSDYKNSSSESNLQISQNIIDLPINKCFSKEIYEYETN